MCELSNSLQAGWVINRRICVVGVHGIDTSKHIPMVRELFGYGGDLIQSISYRGSWNDLSPVISIYFNNLKQISATVWNFQNRTSSDDDVQLIAKCCSQLQVLTVAQSKDLTDAALVAVAAHCHQLKAIHFRYCSAQITDQGFVPLVKNCPKLVELTFDTLAITDASLEAIARYLPRLRMFSTVKHDSTTNNGWIALAEHCSQLETLTLRECHDEVLIAVSRSCSKLKYLNVYACEHITNVGIKALSEHCVRLSTIRLSTATVTNSFISGDSIAMRSLRTLCLRGIDRVDETFIKLLAQHCPLLHTLCIAESNRINDAAVAALTGCKLLEVMLLANCAGAFNTGLITMVQGCTNMLGLTVNNNIRITDSTVRNIMQIAFPAMRVVRFLNCGNISAEVMRELSDWNDHHW